MPPAFRPELARFNQWIRAMPDDFAIWAEWYEGVLDGARNGTYLFGLPTEAALRLNVDIALIDEALWNGPPAALHAEMRRLVEAAREKQLSPGTPTAGTPDKEQASSALPSVEEGKKGPSNAKPKPVNPVVKNAHSIALNAHLLLPIIEAELARLDDFRPNSNEEIEKKDAAVAYLKKLRGNLEALRDSAANAQADQASAIKAEQSVGVFRRTFERFMDEKGVELLSDASKASIFVGGVSVLAACGAGVAVPSLVIGAIVAGKPLVEILKAARGMIKVEIKLPGAP